jgi:hypothetical protein
MILRGLRDTFEAQQGHQHHGDDHRRRRASDRYIARFLL